MRAALAFLLLFLLLNVGCSEPTGPIARIKEFTRCTVPAHLVRVEEQLSGEGDDWVMHARVIMAPGSVDEFVTSCGHDNAALSEANAADYLVGEPLGFWNPPADVPGRGHVLTTATSFESALVTYRRDSDVAVFVRTRGRGADR